MLTKKQHELLIYLHRHIRSSGVSPSFEEMKAAINLKSKSGVHRLITALEERGFIRRLPHKARAIEILKLPHEAATKPIGGSAIAPSSIPDPDLTNVVQGEFNARANAPESDSEVISLPLYGAIAAGTPIEALRDPSNFIDVPANFLDRGEHFALEVAGDSMVDAGILDGDTAVIRRGEVAESGAIVVALIDDQEATLKRLRRKGNSVALEPANDAYETRIFPPNRVRIQGQLIAILRRY